MKLWKAHPNGDILGFWSWKWPWGRQGGRSGVLGVRGVGSSWLCPWNVPVGAGKSLKMLIFFLILGEVRTARLQFLLQILLSSQGKAGRHKENSLYKLSAQQGRGWGGKIQKIQIPGDKIPIIGWGFQDFFTLNSSSLQRSALDGFSLIKDAQCNTLLTEFSLSERIFGDKKVSFEALLCSPSLEPAQKIHKGGKSTRIPNFYISRHSPSLFIIQIKGFKNHQKLIYFPLPSLATGIFFFSCLIWRVFCFCLKVQ